VKRLPVTNVFIPRKVDLITFRRTLGELEREEHLRLRRLVKARRRADIAVG
jgi:hypothetical protein